MTQNRILASMHKSVISIDRCLDVLWRKAYNISKSLAGRKSIIPLAVLLVAGLVSAVMLHIVEIEYDNSPYGKDIGQSMKSICIFILSGFDVDDPPVSDTGWMIAIFALIIGIAFVAVLTADLASVLVKMALDPSQDALKNTSGHFLIAGWGREDMGLVRELLGYPLDAHRHVVLVDKDIKAPSSHDPYLHYINGSPMEQDVLERAGIDSAEVAIIPTDWRAKSDILRDSLNTMKMLAVEGCNPEVYSCVEIVKAESCKHLQRTAVDEIICLEDLSVKLLSQAALNHGFSNLIYELSDSNSRNRLKKLRLPEEYIGWEFRNLFNSMKRKYDAVVVAIERRSIEATHDVEIIENPSRDLILQADDILISI